MPVVWFLSGLTCTQANFTVKAGAQRVAAELGLIVVAPDTSPRGEGVPDDPEGAYDFGLGRRLLRRCDAGALVAPLPDAQLHRARAAGAGRAPSCRPTWRARGSRAIRWAATAR